MKMVSQNVLSKLHSYVLCEEHSTYADTAILSQITAHLAQTPGPV